MATPTISHAFSDPIVNQCLDGLFRIDTMEYEPSANLVSMLDIDDMQGYGNEFYSRSMSASSSPPSQNSTTLQSTTPGSGTTTSPSANSCIQAASKRKQYDASEWEKNRPIITKLYLKPTKLEEVTRIMQRDYDFNATIAMYKKRFALWGIRKYMTTSEKESILKRLGSPNTTNVEMGSLGTDQIKKVWRHARKETNRKRFPSTTLQVISKKRKIRKEPACVPKAEVDTVDTEPVQSELVRMSISLPRECKSSQLLFNSLDVIIRHTTTGSMPFNRNRLSMFAMEKGLALRSVDAYFSYSLPCKAECKVQESLRFLEIGRHQAAEQGFAQVAKLLSRCAVYPTFRFLMILIRTCFYSIWREVLPWYSRYTRLILETLERALGKDHSLAIFFKNFIPHRDQTDVYKVLCQRIVDSMGQHSIPKQPDPKRRDRHESNFRLAKQSLRRANVRLGCFDEAVRISEELKQHYVQRGKTSRTRECSRFMARMNILRGRADEGLDQYKELTVVQGKPDLWACDAAHQMGLYYWNAKDYHQSQEYCTKAFHWFLDFYGPTHSETLLAFRDLLDCHRKLENGWTLIALEILFEKTAAAMKDRVQDCGRTGVGSVQDLDMAD